MNIVYDSCESMVKANARVTEIQAATANADFDLKILKTEKKYPRRSILLELVTEDPRFKSHDDLQSTVRSMVISLRKKLREEAAAEAAQKSEEN